MSNANASGGTQPRRFLRKRAVIERTGIPTASLYEMMARGEFPKPVKLSTRMVGWLESEIEEWIEERIAARDSKPAA